MRLEPRSTGQLDILHGASGKVRCKNVAPTIGNADAEKISFIFDPAAPSFLPVTRLNPERRGPLAGVPFEDGGSIQITNDAFKVMVDALHPGDAFLDASTATSANTVVLDVRAPRLGAAAGTSPTKTRAGSALISSKESEANVSGRSEGRPVTPKGTGRKINIFGSGETPGFEDYTTDLAFSVFFATGQSDNGTAANERFRPWTEDGDAVTGIQNGTVSDICIRDSPIKPLTITVIRRIAQPKCRLTYSATPEGAKVFLPVLKAGLPGARTIEEFPDAIVMELP